MKKERLFNIVGEIDDKYVEESVSKKSAFERWKIAAVAACLALVVGISLTIALLGGKSPALPEGDVVSPPFAAGEGDYSSLIALVGKSSAQQTVPDWYIGGNVDYDDSASPAPGTSGSGGDAFQGNGSYIENTDNQVAGVTEGDLMKMTDKYIFRLGYSTSMYDSDRVLKVYSVNKDNSELVSQFVLPVFGGDIFTLGWEMYLSEDARTATLVYGCYDSSIPYGQNGRNSVVVLSLDVSDVHNISIKNSFMISGSIDSSRMVGGNLLLFTTQSFNRSNFNPRDYKTFIPYVTIGDEVRFISPDRVVMPDNMYYIDYTTVLSINQENLEIVDAISLLNYDCSSYVSENSIYLTRVYRRPAGKSDDVNLIMENVSDVAVIDYSADGLRFKGDVTVAGLAKDQYSFDERDGYLRVVTTTSDFGKVEYDSWFNLIRRNTNVSLYVIDLRSMRISASVENFAPEGEEATSVRFEGEKLYVCTAEMPKYSDPVYFFDLSDYSNITYADTGYISGFSTSLIDLGDGYLLGIGAESQNHLKLEVYKKEGDSVVSVDKCVIYGYAPDEYKAYLIDRENNLFGFAATVSSDEGSTSEKLYLIYRFDGEKLSVVKQMAVEGLGHAIVRSAIHDGYLYITTYISFYVEEFEI